MKNKSILIFILSLSFLFSACAIEFKGSGETAASTGGVFQTINNGRSWKNTSLVANVSGQAKSFSSFDMTFLIIDPTDPRALYYGTVENGVFYSYDSGSSWRFMTALGKATVSNFAVDPKNHCTLYASLGCKLMKSVDCGRVWTQVYVDNDRNVVIRSIAIDHYNSNIIYMAISRGDLVKSSDGGGSWQSIQRFGSDLKTVKINPKDSREIYVLTSKKGLHVSRDGGAVWSELKESLKEHEINNSKMVDLFINAGDENLMFLVNYYKLLKSSDNGKTWQGMKLITPDKKSQINSFTINAKNSKEMYYLSNNVLYYSNDGGENWTTFKLPTSRLGKKIIINPKNPASIYLGVKLPPKN